MSTQDDEEISFGDFAAAVWSGKYILVFFLLVSLCLGGIFMWNASYKFESSMIIMPPNAAKSSKSSLGSLAAAGAALGFSTGALKDDQPIDELIGNLYTLRVAELLEQNNHVLRRIYSDRWDEQANGWRRPEGLVTDLKVALRKLAHRPTSPDMGPADLQEYISKWLTVKKFNPSGSKSADGPYWSLTLRASSPELAAYILENLYRTAEDDLKARKASYTDRLLDYVRTKLSTVTVQDYREVLLNTIGDLEQQRMLMGPQVPYSSLVVDDATIEPDPISPRLAVVLPVSVLLGLGIGLVLAFVRYRWIVRRVV